MLEDDFNDVLAKAIRGTEYDIATLDLNPQQLDSCLNGEFDADIITALAPALGLNTEKILQLPQYRPHVNFPCEVQTFISPFGHLGVNAFTIMGESHILIFDTGTDVHSCITYLARHPNKEKHLFITHPHHDHIGCEQTLKPHINNSQLLKPNEELSFGNLTLSTIDVAGHHPNAIAYLVEGLETPVCVLGDAIFAGSVGGVAPSLYETALANIRENILSLKPETILLNGHGPSTTVELEIQNNPFF